LLVFRTAVQTAVVPHPLGCTQSQITGTWAESFGVYPMDKNIEIVNNLIINKK
jgi:hypothetical protein